MQPLSHAGKSLDSLIDENRQKVASKPRGIRVDGGKGIKLAQRNKGQKHDAPSKPRGNAGSGLGVKSAGVQKRVRWLEALG
jgi:hypothetical protein